MFSFMSSDQFLILCFLSLLLTAAWRDAVSFRIPNAISLCLLLLYPLHVLASPVQVPWLAGGATAATIFAVGFFAFSCGLVGGGDVKLLTAAALWAGSSLVMPLLLLMGFAGGVLAVTAWSSQQLARQRRLPAGMPAASAGPAPIHLPYGIAIAFGGAFTALQLLFV